MSDLPRLLTLQEASAKLGGKIKPRALRTEARHGRLHLTRIAGKDFVTESDLGEMLTRCRAARKDLGSLPRLPGLSECPWRCSIGSTGTTTQTTWQRQRVDADESVHAMRQMLHQQHVHEHAGNRRC